MVLQEPTSLPGTRFQQESCPLLAHTETGVLGCAFVSDGLIVDGLID